MRKELIIFEDCSNGYKESASSVLHWNGYKESALSNEYSILQIVEKESEKLKNQYLSLIYELGKLRVNNSNTIEYLKIRNNFSLWWMTLLAEKCNFSKSTQINDVIKLMALSNWLKNKGYSNIIFTGSSKKLANSIELMSLELSIKFRHEKTKRKELNVSSVKSFYRKLPKTVQAIVWIIKYCYTRWPLKGAGLSSKISKKPLILFVSYFDNLHLSSLKDHVYKSRYWGGLPKLLEDESLPSNWLHIYAQDDIINSPKDAAKILRKFNNVNQKNHVFLDSFLSIGLVFRVLSDWKNLGNMTIVEKKIKLKLGCYYPLLMSDIKESFYGVNMVSNLLTFNLFERSMQYFSHQTKGFFLYEGQGWEYGLVSAWKNFGNGQITGVSHTPLKYWDLRSFFDPRSYVKNKKNLVNFPDFLAVNGEFYKSLLIEGCFPSDRVVELEALRYGYLENFSNTKCCNKKLRSNRLLVVTDYMWDNTKYQLEVLEKALLNTDHILEIIIKPHPNCPIPKNYNLSFDYQVLSDPIEKLLKSAQVVFSSNATSASVDAYSTGKKIIVMLDPNGLNLSPLNGVKDVFFIGSPGELSLAFDSYFDMENNDIINNREKFFIIDNELPRWKKVLIL